jgi:radical SAM superfamily enzyme YgiQ (UPF0313 family)
MNDEKSLETKPQFELIMILPLGLEEGLFPWGIHSIKEYIENSGAFPGLTVKVWDFRKDPFFSELNRRYGQTLGRLFLSMGISYTDSLAKITNNPYIFLGTTGILKDDFFSITHLVSPGRKKLQRDLRQINKELSGYTTQKIEKFLHESDKNTTRIWAISVYDYSIFFSMYIALNLKNRDTKSKVILGGDYFDFISAKRLLEGEKKIDGIVVGYGEEVMRQIIADVSENLDIRQLPIPGFMNSYSLLHPEENLDRIVIPPSYSERFGSPLVSYVQKGGDGEIRILSQRGCSWGKCVFCTQLDKDMYFPISVEHLIRDIQLKLDEIKNVSGEKFPIKISFDSDENSMEMLIDFLKYLDGLDMGDTRFEIVLWMQVKSFRPRFAKEIAMIKNKNIRILFRLNFESLNVETLRNMGKGHLPLMGIEAAKALQDTGQSFTTNYFTHYPLETRKSTAEEVEYLSRILHLFAPPNGGGSFFTYYPNNRDSIFRDQEKYKVKIRRLRGDKWMRYYSEFDLPFSLWSYEYTEVPSLELDRLLIWTYYNSLKAGEAVAKPRRIVEKNWGKLPVTLRETVVRVFKMGKLLWWKALHNFFHLFSTEKSFKKRTKLFLYLSTLQDTTSRGKDGSEDSLESRFTRRSISSVSKKGVHPSYFFIAKEVRSGEEVWTLNKEYNAPDYVENWSRVLDQTELGVLRHFYFRGKRADGVKGLIETLNLEETKITEIIEHHLNLGSLIAYKESLLCVVNDPGYWKENR